MIETALAYIKALPGRALEWAAENPLITLGAVAGAGLVIGIATGLIGR